MGLGCGVLTLDSTLDRFVKALKNDQFSLPKIIALTINTPNQFKLQIRKELI
jgi:hypothetical protein